MSRIISSILILLILIINNATTTFASNSPDYQIFSYSKRHEQKEEITKHLHIYGFVAFIGVPKYSQAYQNYIKVARKFVHLTEKQKTSCSPENNNIRGWSYGIEKFNGMVDSHKGSYYAFVPEKTGEENIWPESFPEFKTYYLNLAQIIYNTGKDVMELVGVGRINTTGLGRMLYYAPIDLPDNTENPNWCGMHRDHSVITGLTAATFIKDGQVADQPEGSGLYVRGQAVPIPSDVLIFQVGETGELITNGTIVATEHLVKKAYGGYSRYAFAMFFDLPMDTVINSTITKYNDRYKPNMTYSEWTDAALSKYKAD